MASLPDPAVSDSIGERWDSLIDLYLDETHKASLSKVRLSSTCFATRESLPPEFLLIEAEYDMFCQEVEVMADELAGDKPKVETKDGWKAPGVQFYKVYGQPHAFDAFAVKHTEKEKARVVAKDTTFDCITACLRENFPIPNVQ